MALLKSGMGRLLDAFGGTKVFLDFQKNDLQIIEFDIFLFLIKKKKRALHVCVFFV